MIIYKTTNLINGKVYIGQDSKNNSEYLGSGLIINRAIDKYGKENFVKEIIEECSSKEELNEREIYWIDKLNATDRSTAYNICSGGLGGDTLTNHPDLDVIKKKISDGQRGRKAWNEGKTNVYSKEHINNLSNIRKENYSGENHPRYVVIDKPELESALKNKTIKDTANHFNISISCLRAKINEYNLVITKKSGNFAKPLPTEVINEILSLRKDKKSITEIASIVGIGIHKTKKVLVANGVNTKRVR